MTKNHRPYSPGRLRGGLAASFAGLALITSPAFAANTTWNGNTDANFGTFANWSTGATPSGNTPIFGTAGSSGTTLNNNLSGATFAGLTFNSGASAFTIGGNSFTLTGNITNNSTNTQTINNAITISGGRTIAATSGQLVFGGNITGSAVGNTTLTPTNKITLGGTNNLTMNVNFAGFNIGAGAGGVDITGSTTITGNSANTQSGYLSVAGTSTVTVQSGGSLTINGTTNASTPNSTVGQNAAGTSTLVVNGGSFNIGANTGFAVGNNLTTAIGVITITSGTATITRGSTTATDIRSFIAMGRDTATGTINLNGGTLATDRNFVRDGSGTADATGAANFVFGGGTLKALANQTDWLNSATINTNQLALSSVTTTAVSTIDANSFSVAINNAISGAGGFNIISSSGAGTVTFGGTNTYNGATTITGGTLKIASGGSISNSALTINGSGATLTGSGTVADITLTSGTVAPGDTGIGTLTGSSLTWVGGNTLTFDLSSVDNTADLLSLSGALTKSGSGTYAFNFSGGLTGQTYTLINFGSNSGFSASDFSVNSGTSGTFGLSGTSLTFTAVPEPHEFALAIVGLLGVMVFIRRRNQMS